MDERDSRPSTHAAQQIRVQVMSFFQPRQPPTTFPLRLLDAVDVADDSFPPCLVFERGNYSLAERLAARHPSSIEQRAIVYSVYIPYTYARSISDRSQILEAVEDLHSHGVTHGNLSPSSIVWFSADFCWKLVDVDYAAHSDEPSVVPPFLEHYAAPELMQAFQELKTHVRLRPSADMWSVGVIAFEMFTGRSAISSSV